MDIYSDENRKNINAGGANCFQAQQVTPEIYLVTLTDENGNFIYENQLVSIDKYEELKQEQGFKFSKPDTPTTGVLRNTVDFFSKRFKQPSKPTINKTITVNGIKIDENTPPEVLAKLGIKTSNICNSDNTTQNTYTDN